MDWCDAPPDAAHREGIYLAVGTSGWNSSQLHLLGSGGKGSYNGDIYYHQNKRADVSGVQGLDLPQDSTIPTSQADTGTDAAVQIWRVGSRGQNPSEGNQDESKSCAALSMVLLLPEVGGAVWNLEVRFLF